MPAWICVTCGVQYPDTDRPPGGCPICEDERQYVGWHGQQWTTHGRDRPRPHGRVCARRSPTWSASASSRPSRSASGPCWCAPRTATCCGTALAARRAGPCAGRRPRRNRRHLPVPPAFLRGQRRVRRRLRRAHLHPARRPALDPAAVPADRAVRRRIEPVPGLTLARIGGHFDGAAVLHWPAGCDQRGALLTGDTITVVQDRDWVSFMWSYPTSFRSIRPPSSTSPAESNDSPSTGSTAAGGAGSSSRTEPAPSAAPPTATSRASMPTTTTASRVTR